MIKIISLILLSEVWHTAGQIFYKKATPQLKTSKPRDIKSYLTFLEEALRLPRIWWGLISLGIGVVFWLMALAQGDLSLVYPLGSIQYLLTLFAARIFLDEKIDRLKLAGTLLVVLGIALIAKS